MRARMKRHQVAGIDIAVLEEGGVLTASHILPLGDLHGRRRVSQGDSMPGPVISRQKRKEQRARTSR